MPSPRTLFSFLNRVRQQITHGRNLRRSPRRNAFVSQNICFVQPLEVRALLAGNSISDSGGFEGSQQTLTLAGNGGGTLDFRYEHFSIPDNFIIRYEGRNLLDTGFVGGSQTGTVSVPAGSSNVVEIILATNNTGTRWNYEVTANSCGDTGPFHVELANGEFADSDSDGLCDAQGTVYVGLKNGINRMLRVENAFIEYDDASITISGGTIFSEFGTPGGPLFQSDLMFQYSTLSSAITPATGSNGLMLGGLETQFTSIALTTNGIYLDGHFELPDSPMFNGFTAQNRRVAMSDGSRLFIGSRGIGFGSDVGTVPFPTDDFVFNDLFGANSLDAGIQYVSQENGQPVNRLVIQGKYVIQDLLFVEKLDSPPGLKAVFDLSDDRISGRRNLIRIENGVADVVGAIKLEKIPLPGGFEISELVVDLETAGGELVDVTGTARIKLPLKTNLPFPPFDQVGAEVGFKQIDNSWKLDDVVLEVDGLDFPILTTAWFLQSVKGGVRNLAPNDGIPFSLVGGLGVTAGSSTNVSFPSWYDIGSLLPEHFLRIDAQVESNLRFWTGTAMAELFDPRVLAIEGRITLDMDSKVLEIPGQLTVFGGVVTGTVDLMADWGNGRASADINGTLKFPDSRFLLRYRNREIAGASGQLNVSFDGNLSNDYVATWGTISMPIIGPKTFGLQIYFDGDWRIIGGKSIPSTNSFIIEAGTEYVLMSADWENESSAVSVRVIDNNGNVIEEADFADRNIAVVEELSGSFARTVVVANPGPGVWDLEVVDGTGLGDINISAERDSETPSIAFISPPADTGGGTVEVLFEAFDTDSEAEIMLFFDRDNQGFNGTMIASGLRESDGRQSYSWDTTGVVPGDYYVYAIVQDENNQPIMSYAPGMVSITEESDLSVAHVSSNNSADTGTEVTYTIDVSNIGASAALETALAFSVSGGAEIISTSVTASSQTLTSVTFDNLGALAPDSLSSFFVVVRMPNEEAQVLSTVSVTTASFDRSADNNQHSLIVAVAQQEVELPDLVLSVSGMPESGSLNEAYTYEITVTNRGTTSAENVVLTENLPSLVRHQITNASAGTTSYSTARHSVTARLGDIPGGASETVEFTLLPFAAGSMFSTTEVVSNTDDADSFTNFMVNANSVASAMPAPADMELSAIVEDGQPASDNTLALTFSLQNSGPGIASGVLVSIPLPEALEFVRSNAEQGTYDATTGIWDVGNVRDGLTRSLTITARVTASSELQVSAEVIAVSEVDPDSTPANGVITEDDFASVSLSGVAEGSISGQKWQDSNQDGVFDLNEAALAGSTIELLDNQGEVVATTITGDIDFNSDGIIDPRTETGAYRFEGLAIGIYSVREVIQPGWRQSSPSDAAAVRAYDLDQAINARKAGNDFRNWGGQDEVWVFSDRGWLYLLPTGDVYQWDADTPGLSGTLLATLSPRFHQNLDLLTEASPASGGHISLEANNTTASLNFGSYLPSLIMGRKWEDNNRNGRHDSGERWLNGWEIELVDTTTGTVVATTVTADIDLNEDGTISPELERGIYRFSELLPGEYVTREIPREGWNQSYSPNVVAERAHQANLTHQFSESTNDFRNWGGMDERWLRGASNWHFITPNGTVHEWNGSPRHSLTGTVIAELDARYHADLTLLTQAASPEASLPVVDGDIFTGINFGSHRSDGLNGIGSIGSSGNGFRPGNVRVTRRGRNIYVTGDNSDNQIAIFSDADGNIVVAGLHGTTVNSSNDPFVIRKDTAGFPRNIIIQTGTGQDFIQVADIRTANHLRISAGAGDDVVVIRNVYVASTLSIATASGENAIMMTDTSVGNRLALTGGAAPDAIVGSNIVVSGGAHMSFFGGNDFVYLSDLTFHHRAGINLGSGNDTLVMTESNSFPGTVSMKGGPGIDTLDILDGIGAPVQPTRTRAFERVSADEALLNNVLALFAEFGIDLP